jgi:hypothetical protein
MGCHAGSRSMWVLAFDLLILPYHEFAGINNIVIEIEQAIR